jgi:Toastrack DUF4097
MMRAMLVLWALCGATVQGLGVGVLAAQEPAWTWSGKLGAGDVLDVTNISGYIHVVRSSNGTATARAEKTGNRSDFDRVQIRVEHQGHTFRICAVYDAPDGEGCRNRTRNSRDDIRVGVNFDVGVPDGVELEVASVTGDLDVRDVHSDVTARTVSGDVEVSTSRVAKASTVSGSLDVEMRGTDWHDLSFSTVSGDITLGLPDGIGADVDFASVSGDLDSDFDISTSGRRRQWIGSHVRGVIGGGGRALKLNTVSGDVRIRRLAG